MTLYERKQMENGLCLGNGLPRCSRLQHVPNKSLKVKDAKKGCIRQYLPCLLPWTSPRQCIDGYKRPRLFTVVFLILFGVTFVHTENMLYGKGVIRYYLSTCLWIFPQWMTSIWPCRRELPLWCQAKALLSYSDLSRAFLMRSGNINSSSWEVLIPMGVKSIYGDMIAFIARLYAWCLAEPGRKRPEDSSTSTLSEDDPRYSHGFVQWDKHKASFERTERCKWNCKLLLKGVFMSKWNSSVEVRVETQSK